MAEKHFTLEIATPRREVLVTQTSDVVLPGLNGEMEVLPGHRPLLTSLRPGRLVVGLEGKKRTFFVSGGYAEILPDRIVVLADECDDVATIDAVEARRQLAEAQQELEVHRLEPAEARAPYQLTVDQADARLRLAGLAGASELH